MGISVVILLIPANHKMVIGSLANLWIININISRSRTNPTGNIGQVARSIDQVTRTVQDSKVNIVIQFTSCPIVQFSYPGNSYLPIWRDSYCRKVIVNRITRSAVIGKFGDPFQALASMRDNRIFNFFEVSFTLIYTALFTPDID